MPGLLVVSHGGVAEELVRAAKTIVGPVQDLEAVSIGWNDDVAVARERIQDAIRRIGKGDGVLILTDMFGGTCANLANMFLQPGRVEVITAANLPMIIKFTNLHDKIGLAEVALRIAQAGRDAIQVASVLLEGRPEKPTGERA